MKVILLDNVRGIGRRGDLKNVNDGYARNFLFPRGLGKPATEQSIRAIQSQRSQELETVAAEREQAIMLAARLEGMVVSVDAKANEKGTLFSALPSTDIAGRISEASGVHIPPDAIISHEHLKHTGPHTVELRLHPSITAKVTVDITSR